MLDLASIRGESGAIRPRRSKTGCPLVSVVGSGQSGTPWERMHWAKSRIPLSVSSTWASLAFSRDAQAFWADSNSELLTPSCCGPTFGRAPLLSGSGKFGTPCERMQREKARGLADAGPLGEEATSATPGLPEPLRVQAAASRVRTAVATAAA